jgi:hypothetical protein
VAAYDVGDQLYAQVECLNMTGGIIVCPGRVVAYDEGDQLYAHAQWLHMTRGTSCMPRQRG